MKIMNLHGFLGHVLISLLQHSTHLECVMP